MSARATSNEEVIKTCFVIMPFSKTTSKHTKEYWTDWWRFLKKQIDEVPNVTSRRSDPLRVDIVDEIIRNLFSADIVIADLTDRNPNVYWELGVRQTFTHGTITIAETRKHIASDMGMKSVLKYYPTDAIKNEEFVSKLKQAIQNCIDYPEAPDSRVLETITGRGSIYQIIQQDEFVRRLDALVQEISSNEFTFIRVYWDIEKNKRFRHDIKEEGKEDEEKEAISFTSRKILHSALDLLLTNRYIDESKDFYQVLINFRSLLDAFNFGLSCWQESPEHWESWFERKKETFESEFILLIEQIERVYFEFTKKTMDDW